MAENQRLRLPARQVRVAGKPIFPSIKLVEKWPESGEWPTLGTPGWGVAEGTLPPPGYTLPPTCRLPLWPILGTWPTSQASRVQEVR